MDALIAARRGRGLAGRRSPGAHGPRWEWRPADLWPVSWVGAGCGRWIRHRVDGHGAGCWPAAACPRSSRTWIGAGSPAYSRPSVLVRYSPTSTTSDTRRRCGRPLPGPTTPTTDAASRLLSLAPADRQRQLLDMVRASAASVLGFDSARGGRNPRVRSGNSGFDSLTAVELRNRLVTATGLAAARPRGLRLPDPGGSRWLSG